MLRIGVTGHRSYDDPDAVTAEVDRALTGLPPSPTGVEVWTSLAEGADRVVARRAIELLGADVVAVLPLVPDDYRADFADRVSIDEFDDLLASAVRTTVTGPDDSGSRTSAYRAAGVSVARSVDTLVAVWDGRPARGAGGTAEIVDVARSAGTRVVVIPVTRVGVRS